MDDTDRHLWDDTIGTARPTDKPPSRAHHAVLGRSLTTTSHPGPQRSGRTDTREDEDRHADHAGRDIELGWDPMSVMGIVLMCWLALATIAFLALSALGRRAARRDVEAGLGIVGDAELRMLVGEDDFTVLDTRLYDVSLT